MESGVIKKVRSGQHVMVIAGSTLLSRALGVLRDIIIFSFFGASAYASAFFLGFTIPNMFRRLLGEGALTAAIIPVLSNIYKKNDTDLAFNYLNKIFSRLIVLLIGLWILSVLVIKGLEGGDWLTGRWELGLEVMEGLMPYMVFICMAAIVGGALNVMGLFGVVAVSAVWLNIAIIVGLGGAAYIFELNMIQGIEVLSYSVLVGGVLQLLFPLRQLFSKGWRPMLDWEGDEHIDETRKLFLPGLIGAMIFQLNVVITRFLAFGISGAAVSILYLANRLVELPQGIFSSAVTTALFPELSKNIAAESWQDVKAVYEQGVRWVFAVTIPASIGLIVLAQPIIEVLFLWGRFSVEDVLETVPILKILSFTIPLYSLAMIVTKVFHSYKDTKTPVKVAVVALVLNVVISVMLIPYIFNRGLAYANLITISVQCVWLIKDLRKKNAIFQLSYINKPLLQILVSSMGMYGCLYLISKGLNMFFEEGKLSAAIEIMVCVPMGIVLYILFLWVMKFEDLVYLREWRKKQF